MAEVDYRKMGEEMAAQYEKAIKGIPAQLRHQSETTMIIETRTKAYMEASMGKGGEVEKVIGKLTDQQIKDSIPPDVGVSVETVRSALAEGMKTSQKYIAENNQKALLDAGFSNDSPSNQLSVVLTKADTGQKIKFVGHMDGESLILTEIQGKDGDFKKLGKDNIITIPSESLQLGEDTGGIGIKVGKTQDSKIIEKILNLSNFQSALENGLSKFAELTPSLPHKQQTSYLGV